ncbi:hypothetical protein NA2_11220 [Nitratireductor pacificus pht-3B]|uniref:Uncharacterized protein n=1 Tax=Nitratireductor pacificus pht-3B TaxID=391937 RepID=K2MD93_9HYPH|nr:hypothetical protein NA2_11220 [Nitratireductor pacificus pht-3B]
MARICWVTAPIYAALGMILGLVMAASGDHTLAPAHGHLNLLGWVTIALYGAFYTLVPLAAESRLARLQVLLAEIGVVTAVPGIAMAIMGMGEGLAKVGSLIILAAMLLFVFIVIRTVGQPAATA